MRTEITDLVIFRKKLLKFRQGVCRIHSFFEDINPFCGATGCSYYAFLVTSALGLMPGWIPHLYAINSSDSCWPPFRQSFFLFNFISDSTGKTRVIRKSVVISFKKLKKNKHPFA